MDINKEGESGQNITVVIYGLIMLIIGNRTI